MANGLTTFRFNASGLRRVLGDLEADIMECLWARDTATIADVHHDLQPSRDLSFNTVMTVMNRLVGKGLLKKQRRGRSYRYAPTQDRASFLATVSEALARGWVRDFSEYAVSQFAAALAQETPEKLDELERLVAEWQEKRH